MGFILPELISGQTLFSNAITIAIFSAKVLARIVEPVGFVEGALDPHATANAIADKQTGVNARLIGQLTQRAY